MQNNEIHNNGTNFHHTNGVVSQNDTKNCINKVISDKSEKGANNNSKNMNLINQNIDLKQSWKEENSTEKYYNPNNNNENDEDEKENPILRILSNKKSNKQNSQVTNSFYTKNLSNELLKSLNNNDIQNTIYNNKNENDNIIDNNVIKNNNDINVDANQQSNNQNVNNENNFTNLFIKNNILSNTNTNTNTKTCLLNSGNTSYLNSIIQNLTNIKLFTEFFLNEDNAEKMQKNIKKMQLAFVLSRIVNHIYIKNDKNYSLESFHLVLSNLNKEYSTRNERNVNMCLNFILKNLMNELNNIKNKNSLICNINNPRNKNEVISGEIRNFNNDNNSIISKIFNWFEITEIHCFECGEVTYYLNSCIIFQLDVLEYYNDMMPDNITLYNCLNFASRKKNGMCCRNCENQKDNNNISSIYKSPKVFIFSLNNGEFDRNLLKIKFILEEKIILKKYIEDHNSPKEYELIGVISIDMNNNKYVSFCKSFLNQNWYFFYEESFKIIQKDEVKLYNSNNNFIPCILFYESIEKK